MKKFIFDRYDSMILIPATISGKSKSDYNIMLALDTGSFYSIINPSIIQEIGAEITSNHYRLISATNSYIAGKAIIDNFSTLGITRTNYPIAVAQLPRNFEFDGLLGNDFLRNHKICIDFPNGLISIQ